ncbi:MAG: TetR/AcrR family transcriptional regulator [Rhodospirillaceae bacterium]|nr:TetR/AcrR family transcriptional regulator [Rhodospirillaceae bacterium]
MEDVRSPSGDRPADLSAGEARKRGRPPRGTEEQRRGQLLKAAETLFLDQGFGAASMDAVAKLAGVSKKTIYAFFPTKEDLFEEVMKAHVGAEGRPVPAPHVADLPALERALADYLSGLAQFILGCFAVRLFRVTIAEAERFPKIAETFYRQGALRSVHELEDWLAAQVKKGLLKLDDPHEGAVMLTSTIILQPLRAAALRVAELPSPEVMEARAASVAKMFVRGAAGN